jgi:hypothetical protein
MKTNTILLGPRNMLSKNESKFLRRLLAFYVSKYGKAIITKEEFENLRDAQMILTWNLDKEWIEISGENPSNDLEEYQDLLEKAE